MANQPQTPADAMAEAVRRGKQARESMAEAARTLAAERAEAEAREGATNGDGR